MQWHTHLVDALCEPKVRTAHARGGELLCARGLHRQQEVGGLEVAMDQLLAMHVRHGAYYALEHTGDARFAAYAPPTRPVAPSAHDISF